MMKTNSTNRLNWRDKLLVKFYLWAIKRQLKHHEAILDNARKSISDEVLYGK